MRCRDCKYFDKNGPYFENTKYKTYKCAYYLLTQLKKTFNGEGRTHAYTTNSLTSEDDTCMFEYTLLTFDD